MKNKIIVEVGPCYVDSSENKGGSSNIKDPVGKQERNLVNHVSFCSLFFNEVTIRRHSNGFNIESKRGTKKTEKIGYCDMKFDEKSPGTSLECFCECMRIFVRERKGHTVKCIRVHENLRGNVGYCEGVLALSQWKQISIRYLILFLRSLPFTVYTSTQVKKHYQEGKLDLLEDKDLSKNFDRVELEELVQVALICTQFNPSNRLMGDDICFECDYDLKELQVLYKEDFEGFAGWFVEGFSNYRFSTRKILKDLQAIKRFKICCWMLLKDVMTVLIPRNTTIPTKKGTICDDERIRTWDNNLANLSFLGSLLLQHAYISVPLSHMI
ncbi:hypothetical protein M9H77_18352 [Catharanthus roseus]|uniref:Uncharacterized protein n=1 Tax=Catharanthus roseus TaxID=4058 RepID=A0ACC0B789_CATRO|nr:hypothetical protein M9H77_18352 [Catharanthus roseus]